MTIRDFEKYLDLVGGGESSISALAKARSAAFLIDGFFLGEEKEEPYDEEKRAATSVLQTAEELSAQVIRNMKRWMAEKDSSGDAPNGMIVDGALSLATLETLSSTSEDDHTWISHAEMLKIVPDIKLANYQLIGVNWLALLHGMKCSIEGKRDTNVNGVLADEMGLVSYKISRLFTANGKFLMEIIFDFRPQGKTVQTIAFLAWLKRRRDTVAIDDCVNDNAAPTSEQPSRPHLIVVPVSVLSNWMREFEKFCPDMNVVK